MHLPNGRRMELVFILTLVAVWSSPVPAAPAVSSGSTSDAGTAAGQGPMAPADIFFLLDSSSSVWYPHFVKMREFVAYIVTHLDTNVTQVGLGVFSNSYRSVDLDHRTKESLLQSIRRAPYLSGDTYTDIGLNGMRTQWFSKNRQRPNAAKIGVLMTDGPSRYRSSTLAEAKLARDDNIWLYSIGVGPSGNTNELRGIASKPTAEFTYFVGSFDGLTDSLSQKFVASTSTLRRQPQSDSATCGQKKKADVMFVYNDAAMSSRNVTQVREFLKNLVGELSMATGNVRTGIISRGCTGGDIELSEHVRRDDFLKALTSQPKPSLSPLLKKLRRQGYDFMHGGRQDAIKMAIVFLDDALVGRADVEYEAKMLRLDGVRIHVIAVGSNYDMTEAKSLAFSQSETHITSLSSYDDLGKLWNNSTRRNNFLGKFCVDL